MRRCCLLAPFLLAACGQATEPGAGGNSADLARHEPPTGSSEIFREMLSAAPGHELIVADLNLPPDAVGEAHYHPWEEFLYVIGGSAILDIEGREERVLDAGQSFVIPPEAVHIPRAGPRGIRAIVIRVHDEGDPVMLPATE